MGGGVVITSASMIRPALLYAPKRWLLLFTL
jgi:hypothetical protein